MDKNILFSFCGDLDDIAYRLECSNRLVLIAHRAFIDGQNEPGKEDFEALFAIYNQQDALIDELRETVITMQAVGREPDTESGDSSYTLKALHESFMAGKEGRPPRHLPDITPADPNTRESFENYREALAASYHWGRIHVAEKL